MLGHLRRDGLHGSLMSEPEDAVLTEAGPMTASAMCVARVVLQRTLHSSSARVSPVGRRRLARGSGAGGPPRVMSLRVRTTNCQVFAEAGIAGAGAKGARCVR
jgi:hypothetical protein